MQLIIFCSDCFKGTEATVTKIGRCAPTADDVSIKASLTKADEPSVFPDLI